MHDCWSGLLAGPKSLGSVQVGVGTLSTVPMAKGADFPVVAWYIRTAVGMVQIICWISVYTRIEICQRRSSLGTNHIYEWIGHHLIGDTLQHRGCSSNPCVSTLCPLSLTVLVFTIR
jgi:hypothetical protein